MSVLVQLVDLAGFMNAADLATGNKAELLQEVLDAAEEWVESKVGSLTSASRTMKVRASGRNLVLPATRLQAVTAVTDPNGSSHDVAALDVDTLAGIVRVPAFVPGTWTVQATPADAAKSIALAVKIIAAHLWQTQRGRAGQFLSSVEDPEAMGPGGQGYAIPRRATDLLAPFMVGRG